MTMNMQNGSKKVSGFFFNIHFLKYTDYNQETKIFQITIWQIKVI